MTTILEAVLEYADLGWSVLPCVRDGTKAPLTAHGCHDASRDADQIRQWFGVRYPNANLAIATGAPSQFFVIDVDVDVKKANGFDALAQLQQKFGPLPVTLRCASPSGGEHFYFEQRPEQVIPCRSGMKPGIDVRGDGGYIIVPPSRIGGRAYAWREPIEPLALAPAWLVELINTKSSQSQIDWAALADGIEQGRRNDQIFRFACSLRARGVTPEEAHQQVLEAAAGCRPPLGEDEALKCLESAYRYPAGPYHMTDMGNAERLVNQHGVDLRYCHRLRKWFVYNGTIWAPDEGEQARSRAKQTARALYEEASQEANDTRRNLLGKWAAQSEGAHRLDAMLSLAQSEAGVPVKMEDLDADSFLLGVANGVIDLCAGEFRPSRREDLITQAAHVAFDPAAACPAWLQFLDDILPSAEVRAFVQRAVGYSLTGNTREHCFFMCHGKGANGKSTFIKTIETLLGDYAKQAPMETLLVKHNASGANNDIARLRRARFVAAVEVDEGRRLAESLVKQLTGGDRVSARFLYSEFFDFVPQFKLWLAANHKPVIRGTDLALWRRVRLIPFTVTIAAERQDRGLGERLLGERAGILNWALAGCQAWQRDGLQEPREVLEATGEYRHESDVLGQFIAERCVQEGSDVLGKLYDAFVSWCATTGQSGMTKRAFYSALQERGFESRAGVGRTHVVVVFGLRVAERYEEKDPC